MKKIVKFLMLIVIFLSLGLASCKGEESEHDRLINEGIPFEGSYEITYITLTENMFSSHIAIVREKEEIDKFMNMTFSKINKFEYEKEYEKENMHKEFDCISLGIALYSAELDDTIFLGYLISKDGVIYYIKEYDVLWEYTEENVVNHAEIVDFIHSH